jgi:hypothetical protein
LQCFGRQRTRRGKWQTLGAATQFSFALVENVFQAIGQISKVWAECSKPTTWQSPILYGVVFREEMPLYQLDENMQDLDLEFLHPVCELAPRCADVHIT